MASADHASRDVQRKVPLCQGLVFYLTLRVAGGTNVSILTFERVIFLGTHSWIAFRRINELLYIYFRDDLQPHLARCAEIFVYKTIVGHLGLKLVEIVLLIRGTIRFLCSELFMADKLASTVYALYNRSFMAKYFLLSVFIIATALEIAGITLIIPSLVKISGCVPPQVKRIAFILFAYAAVALPMGSTELKDFEQGRCWLLPMRRVWSDSS